MNSLLTTSCPLLIILIIAFIGCTPPPPEDLSLASFNYDTVDWPRCAPLARHGQAGRSDDEVLDGKIKFSVRTPNNYDPTRQHPLIVVYAPARYTRHRSEALVKLTTPATRAGFVIAFADSRRLSVAAIKLLSQVPIEIAKKWCVDQKRIYLTGHSDGGTITNAIAFLPEMPLRPRAIAPSAAGIRRDDMKSEKCPDGLAVMTLQNNEDDLFPGYGEDLAAWWAVCNQCSNSTRPVTADCREYIDCATQTETLICSHPGTHSQWPSMNEAILEFFKRH